MKTLAIPTTIMVLILSFSALANINEMRADIDVDIPLAEAIERENEQFPDGQPLTEERGEAYSTCVSEGPETFRL